MADTTYQAIEELHAGVCAALADSRRIMLLYALAGRPHCVGSLAEALGMSQPAVSRHLKQLRDQGLVQANRHGTSVEYALADPRLTQILDLLRAILRDRLVHQAALAHEPQPVPVSPP